MLKSYIILVFIFVWPTTLMADQPIIVKHYQQHERYEFGGKLLNLALSKLNLPYEVIPPKNININEARGELEVISGGYDIQWLSTTTHREATMIPIKIPVYRGILGLRLILITKKNHNRFSQLKTLKELQAYTGGHGTHWMDLPVYKENNLKVITYINYDSLFKQLEHNFFDYFHRGLNEIWKERARYKNTLSIADNIMLFYPQPVYFFVSKKQPELAKLIGRGLKVALRDGSFKKLFLEFHQNVIQQGGLPNRTLITLRNPDIPAGSPPLDTHWWLPEKFQKQVKDNNVY